MSSRLLSLPGADPFGRLGQETGDLGSVSAVVMLGGCGDSPAEQLVHGARREAMHASLAALIASQRIARVVIAAPQSELDALSPPVDGKLTLDPDALGDSFHFGRRLGAIAARYNLDRLIYLGGGSAPLLPTDELDAVIDEIETAPARHAVTNNLYSSDWIAMTEARTLQGFAERLPQDNMLGWVLQEEIGYTVRALPPEAATRVDIDTPADLLALYWHPACPVNLRAYLDVHMPAESLERWRAAGRALATPATQIALLGRVSASVWRYVDRHTRCWIRVFSEERGMTASGRKAAGAVRSLLAEHIDQSGVRRFFQQLDALVDAAFFDTRVYLAHHQYWPSAADRFAADLGWVDQVRDVRLRQFAQAVQECAAPILLGGHGVVAGDLYALIEIINAGIFP